MTKNNKITVYQELLKEKSRIAKAIKNIEQSIIDDIQSDIDNQLSDKEYKCGTATIDYQGHVLKVTVAKKINYDNNVLAYIAKRIIDSGDDLSKYMKVEYKISETNYKNWSSNIQKEFIAARTVKPNTPKIEIKDSE